MEAITEKIKALKEEKNAIILGHYYQRPEIQEISDFVGDSLELSRRAMTTDADIIVFAGVFFMAETAKILNPSKKVLVPDLDAGCSLEMSCPPEQLKAFKDENPDHIVLTYINASAGVKALSDYICTSSNAEKILASIPEDKPLLFAPDKNLGAYLMAKTGRKMDLWDGVCIVHEAFSLEKLVNLKMEHKGAKLVAHPESGSDVLKIADFIGSTSKMIDYIENSEDDKFIVGTEAGILHELKKRVPHKELIPVPIDEDNTCSCSECAFMKLNTLEKIADALENEAPEVHLDPLLIEEAKAPLERMMAM
ncbi:MAG: quinolinate synthase NadA [Schleiferiaceae bacterium]